MIPPPVQQLGVAGMVQTLMTATQPKNATANSTAAAAATRACEVEVVVVVVDTRYLSIRSDQHQPDDREKRPCRYWNRQSEAYAGLMSR